MAVPAVPRGGKPLNTAVHEAAQARVDEALPLQHSIHELVGLPVEVEQRIQAKNEARAKGGRPPGARNRRLAEIAELARKTLGDGLLQGWAIATMPVDHLMALGLSAKEALEEKRLYLGTVLPYIEQRQPVRVDMNSHSVVHLSITDGVPMGGQNQGLIEAVAVQLDGARLDNARNPLMVQANAADAQLIADQSGAAPADPTPPLARPATPPGGGDFAPAPLPRAPAGVVPPSPGLFGANPEAAPHGPGGAA